MRPGVEAAGAGRRGSARRGAGSGRDRRSWRRLSRAPQTRKTPAEAQSGRRRHPLQSVGNFALELCVRRVYSYISTRVPYFVTPSRIVIGSIMLQQVPSFVSDQNSSSDRVPTRQILSSVRAAAHFNSKNAALCNSTCTVRIHEQCAADDWCTATAQAQTQKCRDVGREHQMSSPQGRARLVQVAARTNAEQSDAQLQLQQQHRNGSSDYSTGQYSRVCLGFGQVRRLALLGPLERQRERGDRLAIRAERQRAHQRPARAPLAAARRSGALRLGDVAVWQLNEKLERPFAEAASCREL